MITSSLYFNHLLESGSIDSVPCPNHDVPSQAVFMGRPVIRVFLLEAFSRSCALPGAFFQETCSPRNFLPGAVLFPELSLGGLELWLSPWWCPLCLSLG